ncbi:MAG: TrmH family RNA methyltransferase [Gammaproteobacteria bacterium]|nr:TrmH family RNA methyltransferase [Gammaproteobacteria bacterium]
MKDIQLNHQHHSNSNTQFPVCVLVHNFESPMNIGSLFRIADALGIEKIFLTGSSLTPPNSKIRKTSRATESAVPWSYHEAPLDVIQDLRSKGYTIVSLEITSNSIDINEFDLEGTEKICLIPGSENYGVPDEILKESDFAVHIPMMGQNSSMNVATACAIAIYKLTESLKN